MSDRRVAQAALTMAVMPGFGQRGGQSRHDRARVLRVDELLPEAPQQAVVRVAEAADRPSALSGRASSVLSTSSTTMVSAECSIRCADTPLPWRSEFELLAFT